MTDPLLTTDDVPGDPRAMVLVLHGGKPRSDRVIGSTSASSSSLPVTVRASMNIVIENAMTIAVSTNACGSGSAVVDGSGTPNGSPRRLVPPAAMRMMFAAWLMRTNPRMTRRSSRCRMR